MFKIRECKNQKLLKINGLVDLLLPQRCALCRCICETGYCQNCSSLLPWIEHACIQCGSHLFAPGMRSTRLPAHSSTNNTVCGQCQLTRPSFSNSIIPFHYKPPISTHIQNLKYSGQLYLSSALGRIISARILQSGAQLPDIIMPIPLHWKRIFHRGFNQSSEISRVIGNQLGIPVSTKHLSRRANTLSQTGLNIQMRRKNTRKAFEVIKPCKGLSIALVDDVVTTGSTVRAASKILIKSGASRIDIWAAAKA